MGGYAISSLPWSGRNRAYRQFFTEKRDTGMWQANMDHNACKCAIAGSVIFNPECTRNRQNWTVRIYLRHLGRFSAITVLGFVFFATCRAINLVVVVVKWQAELITFVQRAVSLWHMMSLMLYYTHSDAWLLCLLLGCDDVDWFHSGTGDKSCTFRLSWLCHHCSAQ